MQPAESVDPVRAYHKIVELDDYIPLVGEETVRRIQQKGDDLRGLHVAHVNSTYYGGGVAELLSSLTLLMDSVGIRTGWRVLQGAPDFFSVTKKMHNALQGGEIDLSELKKEIYQTVTYQNSVRNHIDHDFVFVHDPQPLMMINFYKKHGPWIWRCHVDLTEPNPELWRYLKPTIEKYDAVIVTLEEYKQELDTPQVTFFPAIDPFTTKNREFSEEEIEERLERYDIPDDLPLVVQISRFDRWKDPEGVIKAFNLARNQVDARLILLGNIATDDPEGQQVYQSLLDYQDDRVRILSREDTALVNALQSRAAVVLQKSIREGFGLTVTEAMWKGAAVIGGNVGGIRYQIEDGVNGFLVDTIEQTADRIVQLLDDAQLREQFGQRARETVRDRYLMVRLLEKYLDLFHNFKTLYLLEQ